MARKNLLAGLTDETLPAGNSGGAAQFRRPRQATVATLREPHRRPGHWRAVSRSIEQIKSQAVVELDTALIDIHRQSPIACRSRRTPCKS